MPSRGGAANSTVYKKIAIVVIPLGLTVGLIVWAWMTFYGRPKEGFEECWCRSDATGDLQLTSTPVTSVMPQPVPAMPPASPVVVPQPAPIVMPVGPPAVDVGPYNAGWSVTSALFPDTAARVIWNAAGAIASAAPNPTNPIVFTKAWNNTTGAPISAKMYALVDDVADITLNGAMMASITNCCVVKNFPLTLAPGMNLLSFSARNMGTTPTPAGILVTVLDSNNNVLFHSDSTWVITKQ